LKQNVQIVEKHLLEMLPHFFTSMYLGFQNNPQLREAKKQNMYNAMVLLMKKLNLSYTDLLNMNVDMFNKFTEGCV